MFRALLIFLASSSTLFSHIIIHMDVNRTIISHDSTQAYSPEDFVNVCLAKSTKACWDPTIEEPIDYYSYVYLHLLPGDRSDSLLRKKRRETIHSFSETIAHSEAPFAPALLEKYEAMVTAVRSVGKNVFPSFYALVKYLEDKNVSYTILLRSFGNDLQSVLQELSQTLNISEIPLFKMQGNTLLVEGLPYPHTSVVKHAKKYRFVGVQDDFFYWNTHNESKEYGKIFPLSNEDISLFFDDNVEEKGGEKNIICPYLLTTNSSIPILPLIQSGHIVRVDTLEALTNTEYFIERLQKVIPEEIHTPQDRSTP